MITQTPMGPMLEGASPALLTELLGRFERALLDLGFPVAEVLRPPADREYVVGELRKRGLEAPQEVQAWFEWHDGSNRIDGLLVPLPTITPAPLDVCLAQYDEMVADFGRRDVSPGDQENEAWGAGTGWLRLEDSSEAVAVECTTNGSEPPRVRYARDDFSLVPEDWYRAQSLCTPVAAWLDACQSGHFEWDESGRRWRILEAFTGPLTHSLLG